MPESSGTAANHPWRIFARVFSGADGVQECPADAEADASENTRKTRSVGSSSCSEATLQQLRDGDRKAVDSIGEDFKRVGLPDWVTQRVEDLIIDHFYRIESDLFHVENELKAWVQEAQAQQLENRALAKRIFNVETELQTLRHGSTEPGGLQKEAQASDSITNGHCAGLDSSRASSVVSTTASTAFAAASAATVAAHGELLEQLRRDLDAHAKFHETRLAAVQHSLDQCCGVLQALGGELTSPPAFAHEAFAEETACKDPFLLAETPRPAGKGHGKETHASLPSSLQHEKQECQLNSESVLQQGAERREEAAYSELHRTAPTSSPALMPAASFKN